MDAADRERAELRREIASHGQGRGAWTPPELRDRAARWIRRRRRDGATLAEIAAELGVARQTIRRWAFPAESDSPERRRRSRRMLPVQVAVVEAQQRTVAVVSPTGFRIEGLSLAEAAAMLRALG